MKPITIVTIGVVLAFALAMAILVWAYMRKMPSDISFHGWIALAIGSGITLAMAGGLVALMQISHRGGYDDRVHWADPKSRERWKSPWED